MGTVNVKITQAIPEGNAMLESAVPRSSELITSGAGSLTSTGTTQGPADIIVVETDTDIWVKIGVAPITAAAGDQHLVSAGRAAQFCRAPAGSSVAVVDK